MALGTQTQTLLAEAGLPGQLEQPRDCWEQAISRALGAASEAGLHSPGHPPETGFTRSD